MGSKNSPPFLSGWVPSPVEALLLDIRHRERYPQGSSNRGVQEGTLVFVLGAPALAAWVALLAYMFVNDARGNTHDSLLGYVIGLIMALGLGALLVEKVGSRDPRHMLARRLALGLTTAVSVGVALSLWGLHWTHSDGYYADIATESARDVPNVGWAILAVPVLHLAFWRLGARAWRFFHRAVLGALAFTAFLTVAAGVTALRYQPPADYFKALPEVTLGAVPVNGLSDNGWTAVHTRHDDNLDGDVTSTFTRDVRDLRFTATCPTLGGSECTLSATLRGRALAHDGATTWTVAPAATHAVRVDEERGIYWLGVRQTGYDSQWHAYRASDGAPLRGSIDDVKDSLAPPRSWVIFSVFVTGFAALLLALGRNALGKVWSKPETWIEGRVNDERMIVFRNGAPRPASTWFQGYVGPVTVIPTAQSGGGPFRADGSPDDGWAVPGARDELVKMVQACRGAVDGSVLALVLVGVAPLVAALVRGLIHL